MMKAAGKERPGAGMTFIHGYLLGGLLLAGVPVLLHLILRQKPRRLPFPAFRFLRQKHRINQRKLRLQHVLLLALRVLVIAALCLALARPRVFSHRLSLGAGRPVAVAMVFDSSLSMEYSAGGLSRLDEAKRRAREVLDEMDGASLVAVLDSGEDAGEKLGSRADAIARVEGLQLRPANGPVNRAIARAAGLLAALGEGEEVPPRFLYVFSDRTRASWDPSTAPGLKVPPGVQAVFVDVGVDAPRDLAIDRVEVVPPVAAPGEKVEVRVTVRGTGSVQENELAVQIDNDPDPDRPVERRPVRLGDGQTDVVVVERP